MGFNAFNLIWFVIALPLAGSIFQALFGKAIINLVGERFGKKAMGTLAVLPIAAAFLIGVLITNQLAQMPQESRIWTGTLFDWIKIRTLHVPFEALIDPLSMTMVLIITGVGSLIHLYATGYMAEDRDYTRFFTYLNLFISFMLVLVLGNNLGLLFIGWEGVGLCSYLLIGFWYRDIANAKAANKAFIVNRIGDWGMSLGIFLIVAVLVANVDRLGLKDTRWLSYDVMSQTTMLQVLRENSGLCTLIALLLFVGACGKSAQFPLYLWLPDAMAGPTPVSALIHAATMVTAGVFMVTRMSFIFSMSEVASAVVAGVGAFTALFAALVAFGQTDIKKVLAYSTVSQLGFMFMACGAGAYWAGMFHVTTHAFFKALLFLGSGAVIYSMSHEQDMRRYGNLWKFLPITAWTMIIGWFAIAGVYGFAGFYSKEAILGGALGNHLAIIQTGKEQFLNVGAICGWIGLFVALLTAGYMTRMTILTFGIPFRKNEERWRAITGGEDHAHHADHHEHVGHAHSHHAEDKFGFFFTDAELAEREALEVHEHNHALDSHHEPKEAPSSMTFPLMVLAFLSIIGGFVLLEVFDFKHWLFPYGVTTITDQEAILSGHPHGWVGQSLVLMSTLAALGGIVYGLIVYGKGLPPREGEDVAKWSRFRIWAGKQFGYDGAMVSACVDGGGLLGNALWKAVDAGFIDGIINGVGYLTRGFGDLFGKLQTGFVRSYALLMYLGGIAIIGGIAYAVSRLGGAL